MQNVDLRVRLQSGDTNFTPRELTQLSPHLRVTLISVQDAFVQHKARLSDQITFEDHVSVIKGILSQPVDRALWKSGRTTYAPEWKAYIDKLIEELPLAKPMDVVARFKADLAEVMR